MNKKIIDVSAWQGYIDWEKVSKEVELAILRASCGNNKDAKVEEYARGCRNNGIPFGVYHFTYATNVIAAKSEAEKFYKSAKDLNPAFWVLDFEAPELVEMWNKGGGYKTQAKNVLDTFVKRLRELGAERIVLYTWEWMGKAFPDSKYNWAFRWYALYGKNTGGVTAQPSAGSCQLHQYTSKGKINGIKSNVDLNQLFGGATLDDLLGTAEKPSEGVVEPEKDIPESKEELPEEDAEERYIVTRLLKQGSIGLQVRWLQNRLNEEGFKCGNVDGIFGIDTFNALRKYQKAKHLKVDGVAGKNTVEALGGSYRG